MPSVRRVYPVPNTALVLGVLSLAILFATWRGASLALVIPMAAIVVGAVLFTAARRALRRADTQIDTILREELGPDRESETHARDIPGCRLPDGISASVQQSPLRAK